MLLSCYPMSTLDFSSWLESELAARSWSQADLARRSKITTASISRIMTGDRKPGPDVCLAIAEAFKIPPESVFRAAGLLPPVPEEELTLDEINHKLSLLPEEARQEVLDFIDIKLNRIQRVNEKSYGRRVATSK